MANLGDLEGLRVRIDLRQPMDHGEFRLVSFAGTFIPLPDRCALANLELANDQHRGEVARQADLVGRVLVVTPEEILRIYPMRPQTWPGRPRSPG